MFTGIIECTGTVTTVSPHLLVVKASFEKDPLKIGESIAINGCCLTLISTDDGLRFDISEETWSRTALNSLKIGSAVNLERAMKVGDRLGGHFVYGHVDSIAEVIEVVPHGDFVRMRFRIASRFAPLLVDKGSVTLDGVSLTVVNPTSGEFDVHLVPHTLTETNLRERLAGDALNVEFDMIAKHVQAMLNPS